MAKTNYSSMYKAEEEVNETPVEEVKVETKKPAKKEKKAAPVVEEVKETPASPTTGKVIGNASLNVRQNPNIGAGIITTLTPGTEIEIAEQSDEWFKIARPVAGFVMKKFVEV